MSKNTADRSSRTIYIDSKRLMKCIRNLCSERGMTQQDLCQCIGVCGSYFNSTAARDGRISKQTALLLKMQFGVDVEEYAKREEPVKTPVKETPIEKGPVKETQAEDISAKETPAETESAAPDQKVSIIQCTLLPVELEEAVANGIIKAITRLTEKDAATLQAILYHAINGALKNNSCQTEQDRRPVYSTKWGPVTC